MKEALAGLHLEDNAGLLLTGGSDVEPRLYGEEPAPETQQPDRVRDEVERLLIDEALQRDVPLLAICRGLQILNVHLGGSLFQHLPTATRHERRTPDRGMPAHSVSVIDGTLLSDIAKRATWEVNSRHHQAIKDPGTRLKISATDPVDGVVEAAELPGRKFVLGVQWHPENQVPADREQLKLFTRFAQSL